MQIQERSYGGKQFRPRPEVFLAEDNSLLIIATPWGNPAIAKSFIHLISSEFVDALQDPDRTVAMHRLDSLNEIENRLRLSIHSAHEDLHDEYNSEELNSGLEIFCMIRSDKKVTWFQVGSPATLLVRDQKIVQLHHSLDLSFDFSNSEPLPPLPKDLLAVSPQVHLSYGTFTIKPGDKMLWISRSFIPASFYSTITHDINLDQITQTLAQDHVDQPFWLGSVDLTDPTHIPT